MSKAFIADTLKAATEVNAAAAGRAADDLLAAIVGRLKKTGKFTLPSFGTFRVARGKAHAALNPRTGEKVKVKAHKTVRFKASPVLKRTV